MTVNLLFWKWSEEFATPSRRRKFKFSDITAQFVETEEHPAMGTADIDGFRKAIDDQFGADEELRPFVFEQYPKCAVINYPNADRFELVPQLAAVGRRFGLNASEF